MSAYRCLGCGHQHDERPAQNRCENCRKDLVVNVESPDENDALTAQRAAADKGPTLRGGLPYLIGGLALLAIFAFIVGLRGLGGGEVCEMAVSVKPNAAMVGSSDGASRAASYHTALVAGGPRCIRDYTWGGLDMTFTMSPTNPLEITRSESISHHPGLYPCVKKLLRENAPQLSGDEVLSGAVRGMVCRNGETIWVKTKP